MKKSIYNMAVRQKGHYLLFNCFSLACVLMSEQEFYNYDNLSLDDNLTNEFKRLRFYVEDDFDEVDEVCYASRCLTDADKQQFYRIYTTLACNAKCPYCYESGSTPITMTKETADAVIDFIKKRMVANTKLTIEWFGGEPLLNKKIIRYITENVKAMCLKKKVKLSSRMISNGFLFDDETIAEAKNEWKLAYVQITLDGLKDTYEKIKGFKEKDSFERVINNIEKLLDNGIAVNIRLNYDDKNIDETMALIEFLGTKFAKRQNLNIYFRRIMGDEFDNSFTASEKTDIKLLNAMIKSGFHSDLLKSINRRDNTCVANMLHAFMINPDGKIGKCSQAMSKHSYVGDVFNGINDFEMVKWCSPRLEEKCLKCKMLPLCNGGCIYEKLQNKNYCFASKKMIEFKLKKTLAALLKDK